MPDRDKNNETSAIPRWQVKELDELKLEFLKYNSASNDVSAKQCLLNARVAFYTNHATQEQESLIKADLDQQNLQEQTNKQHILHAKVAVYTDCATEEQERLLAQFDKQIEAIEQARKQLALLDLEDRLKKAREEIKQLDSKKSISIKFLKTKFLHKKMPLEQTLPEHPNETRERLRKIDAKIKRPQSNVGTLYKQQGHMQWLKRSNGNIEDKKMEQEVHDRLINFTCKHR